MLPGHYRVPFLTTRERNPLMDPAMAVAVVCAVIGAAGTVAGAWIEVRGGRPRRDRILPGDTDRPGCVPGADPATDRETRLDGQR
jgi:hypothetical protein